jgi:hypothetical protein
VAVQPFFGQSFGSALLEEVVKRSVQIYLHDFK